MPVAGRVSPMLTGDGGRGPGDPVGTGAGPTAGAVSRHDEGASPAPADASVAKERAVRHLDFTLVTNAPIERAFRLATDPAHVHELMPFIDDVHDVVGDGDAVGDSFRFRDSMLGLHPKGRAAVTFADPPRSITVVTTYDNGVVVDWTMRFTPALEGTEVENDIDYELPAGALGRVADDLVLHRFLEHRLRQLGERFLEIADREPTAATA